MNKQEFLLELRKSLLGLTPEEIAGQLAFYSEMIDDKMEEGLSEEEAVREIGPVYAIVSQMKELPAETIKSKKRRGAWEIVLLVLGAPIWLSLLIAASAVALSLYVSLWSVIVSLWAAFVSLAVSALGGIAAGIVFALNGSGLAGIAMIGAAVICAGLSIFLFFGCSAITKGACRLTKKLLCGIFRKKEEA